MGGRCAFLLLLSLSSLCCRLTSAGEDDYDPGSAIRQRTERYLQVCKKYSDPRRVEHDTLFNETPSFLRYRLNVVKKVAVCAAQKVGSNSWVILMKRLHIQDHIRLGAEEIAKLGPDSEDADAALKWFEDAHKILMVRHPLERILSSYIFVFVDSHMHRDLSAKIRDTWLSQRSKFGLDPLKPVTGEEVYDSVAKPTITFRQFVNFLLHCSAEMADCKVYTSEGIAQHWQPMWRYCQVCHPGIEFQSVLELGPNLDREKDFLFQQLGLNATTPLEAINPTFTANPKELETKKKYYGQLTKSEIHSLYTMYKLDHELFGYSPEEYIAMGKDVP